RTSPLAKGVTFASWACASPSLFLPGMQLLQVFIGIQGGHAAGAGGGDCLSIDMISDVPRGEDARDARGRRVALDASLDLDVALAHVQLTGKDRSVGGVSDGDKQACHIEFASMAVVGRT